MRVRLSKQIIIAVCGVAILGIVAFTLSNLPKKAIPPDTAQITPTEQPTPQPIPNPVRHEIIGKSVEGRNIDAYIYGTGATHLLFVGGIHGGYEWNSVLLAYQFMDYVKESPDIIPKNITVAIIPSANPDGVYRVIGKNGRFTIDDVPTTQLPDGTGRFNAHGVDLNRNFDCNWAPKSTWKGQVVSAGTKVFSEPEAIAIRDFVSAFTPSVAIFWHSKANAVYASECNDGILPQTLELMNLYARASKYTPIKTFDSYKITGDVEGWLASINIPAITVELKTHETVEWEQNLAGFQALLKYYGK